MLGHRLLTSLLFATSFVYILNLLSTDILAHLNPASKRGHAPLLQKKKKIGHVTLINKACNVIDPRSVKIYYSQTRY